MYGDGLNDDVKEALASDDQMVIVNTVNPLFTEVGHYMTATGYRENGNINIDDPNYFNYTSNNQKLVDGYENGFSEETVNATMRAYYIFDFEEPTLSMEEIEEIIEKGKEAYPDPDIPIEEQYPKQ